MLILNNQRFASSANATDDATSLFRFDGDPNEHLQQSCLITFLIPQKGRIEYKPLVKFLVGLSLNDDLRACVLNFDRLCAMGRGLIKSRNSAETRTARKGRSGQAVRLISTKYSLVPSVVVILLADSSSAQDESDTSSSQTIDELGQAFEQHCASFLKWFVAEGAMLEASKPLLIHILSKNWDQEDLIELINDVAKRAGMDKVYAEDDEDVMYLPGMLITR